MQIKGICRVGTKSLSRVSFEDGGYIVQGVVFGLSDRGMPVMQKLTVRGGGDDLVGLPQGTLLRVEGDQFQETFTGKNGEKRYITVIDAWSVRPLVPDVRPTSADVEQQPVS